MPDDGAPPTWMQFARQDAELEAIVLHASDPAARTAAQAAALAEQMMSRMSWPPSPIATIAGGTAGRRLARA
eukprot:10355165-Alexandrium_andersonii.AAC.1